VAGLFKSGNNFLWIHRLLSFTFGKLIAVSNWALVRKCKPYLFFVVGMLLFAHSPNALAQYIKIKGVVIDSVTNEPLPFVNVAFKDKNVGTTTDINGKYVLETQWGSSVLLFSCMGYERQQVSVSDKPIQEINVKMVSTAKDLEEFVIQGKKQKYSNKENPAVVLIRNVLAHRDENRGKTFEYFEYEKYVKSEYDLNNFTESWLDTRGMQGFQVLKDFIDTSDLNGKPFVPIVIQEKISSVYERFQGQDAKEIVLATKVSGTDDGNFSSGLDQFMTKIGGEIDIYESKIILFDKSFVSPIAAIGPTIYRYYITDSVKTDGVVYKKLSFMPRNHTMTAFTGYMWVADSTLNYGVQKIELNIDKRMNINYLDDMRITQEFERDSVIGWHLIKDKMIVDFQPLGKTLGVFNTKTVSYSKFKVNEPRADEFYKGLNSIVYLPEEEIKSDSFWVESRHEPLNESEEGIYFLADSIQNIRQFKTFKTITTLLGSAYLKVNKVDIGPMTSLVSYNTVEGIRIRAGFRTNLKFDKNWRITAWGAYGLEDKRFKYYGQLEYFWTKNPYRRLSVSYFENTYQPGLVISNIPPDHYLLSFRRTPSTNMFYVQNLNITYDREWFNGLTNSFEVNLNTISATRFNTMYHAVTHEIESAIVDNSVTLGTRFSVDERFIQGDFMREPIKTTAPVYTFKYRYSGPAFGSDYEYSKLYLKIEKRFMVGVLGFTDIEVEGAKLIGKVPYPLLIIHRGNETISYEKTAYNLMNFMEFASDQSVGIFAEHHFDGLIFGLIPGVRHSKMRFVVGGKVLFGSVSEKNRDFSNDPDLILKPERLSGLNQEPYVEASMGIENIFTIFRFDIVKRFTYLDAEQIGSFMGINGLAPRIAFKLKF
jgi:hypothetical protein